MTAAISRCTLTLQVRAPYGDMASKWMETTLALTLALLVAEFYPVSTHPQCLDSQPPFVDRRTWRTLYCNQYRDFGCCYKDWRQSRRVPKLLPQITADGRNASACEPYLRNVTCLDCSPYAAHIFDSEGSGAQRVFPLLCRDYCEEAYVKCYRTFLRYYRYLARDFEGVVNNPKGDEALQRNAKLFCNYVLPEEDGPYCYPKVLDGPQFPADENQTTTSSENGELGCICGDPVARGLRNPLAAVHAGDGSGRLFVVEQIGVIHVLLLSNRTILPRPFLDISGRVRITSRQGDERGLLGLSFHPEYKNNGRFFIYYCARPRGDVRVSEFIVSRDDPNVANSTSERVLLTVPQPRSNHNGGQMLFKDGYMLVFLGDGGGAGDNTLPGRLGNAQDRCTQISQISAHAHKISAPPHFLAGPIFWALCCALTWTAKTLERNMVCHQTTPSSTTALQDQRPMLTVCATPGVVPLTEEILGPRKERGGSFVVMWVRGNGRKWISL